jgi:hypothetical protein
MADQTQTEEDTAKAESRTTKSGEFQKRADAKKEGASGAKQAAAPAAEQSRRKKQDENRIASTQRDTDRAASRVTRSGEYQRRIDASSEAEQVGTKQGNIDFTSANNTSGGGDNLSVNGFTFYYADGEIFRAISEDVFDGVDIGRVNYYTLTFLVSAGKFNSSQSPTFVVGSNDPFDGLAPNQPQTYYRLFFMENGQITSTGGAFKENIRCVNGTPIVEWVRIS